MHIIGGIAFGEGCLLVLLTLAYVVMTRLARGPYAGYAFLYALMFSPIGLVFGGALGVFGWFTMDGLTWAKWALVGTLGAIVVASVIFAVKVRRKQTRERILILLVVPHLIPLVLLFLLD